MRIFSLFFSWMLLLSAWSLPAQAQLAIDITRPGQTRANIALPQPLQSSMAQAGQALPVQAPDLEAAIRQNVGFMPFLHEVVTEDVLGGNRVAGPTGALIDFKRFSLSEVDLVVTQAWETKPGSAPSVQLRTYEVFGGRLLFGLEFSDVQPEKIPDIADAFCARLMKALTGVSGFFDSQLAFVRKTGGSKEIWVAGPTGRNARQVTDAGGVNLSPAWSVDGSQIAFTHVSEKGHLLGLVDPRAIKAKPRLLNLAGSSVIGPAFAPDGHLAVTLDLAGEPNIYLLDLDKKKTETLARSWSIDVSPSFDQSGRQMAFTSGRLGNPNIFLMDVPTKQTKRISYEGKYNTSPSLSPDGRLLVYARDTDGGHRLILHDLATGMEHQLTDGPGSDEEPTFGPDGYYIAFASNRSGEYKVYLTTRHGDTPVLLPTGPGQAKSPAWTRKNSNSRKFF